ncbi:hypothetical protein IMSAGC007_04641 [Lachnospiraceae bacterium]|jgi:hypothetical protein|nr:hypothetical protein IMSAGC007_04641 [Lachnospiraceae bacterium]
MKCPKCGGSLRQSTKDPSYGLCDNCKKKYKWVDEVKPKKNSNLKKKSNPKAIITVLIVGIIVLSIIYAVTPKKKSDEYIQKVDSYFEQINTLGESYQDILQTCIDGEITTDEFMSQMGDANSQMIQLTSDVLSLDETKYSKKIAEIGNSYNDMAQEIMNYINLGDSSAIDEISSLAADIISDIEELDTLRAQIKK